jgi:hypothetical protein
MLSLNNDALAVIAAKLPSNNLGNLRCVSKQIHANLEYSAKFAVIQNKVSYSDEMCHRMVSELSQYASDLSEGFEGGDAKKIQENVDAQNNKLLEESNNISIAIDSQYADFSQRKKALDEIRDKDEQCESQSKRLLCQQDYSSKLAIIQEQHKKVSTELAFAKNMILKKRELLSLEHIVFLSKFSPTSDPTEIHYEQKLIMNFHSRVEIEVNDCGVANLDKSTYCAQLVLNSRSYLVPFTSSPDMIYSYLKQLDEKLVSEIQKKYPPKPNYFSSFISLFFDV